MKNEITIILRAFPVIAHDHRTGREEALTITVTKEQLQAATLVGQSSNELLERMLDRQGYTLLEAGTPDKLTVKLDVAELVELVERHEAQQKESWLATHIWRRG